MNSEVTARNVLFLRRINVIGIYVVMFQVILKTLVRVLFVFVILIIAFSMALYMLMMREVSTTRQNGD